MNTVYKVERCPGRRRSIMWLHEYDYEATEAMYLREPKLHVINAPNLVFCVAFNPENELLTRVYVFVEEDNKWHTFDAPNSNVTTPGRVCLGSALPELNRRMQAGKPPHLAEIYWSSVFVAPTNIQKYTFAKKQQVPDSIKSGMMQCYRETFVREYRRREVERECL